jgi:hypothetical protein
MQTSASRLVVRTAVAVVAIVLLLAGLGIVRRAVSLPWLSPAPEPRITHELVVDQLRDVAKLVSTEMTMRDVVIYEQSRFGFSKRALLVVTGKVLAGINLERGTDVRIDHRARLITIVLPPAEVLAVDVLDVHTYDERSGLFNPFRPEDRDAMQRQVRNKLLAAGQRSGLLAHADQSARQVLRTLLAHDGYTVMVLSPSQLVAPTG